MKAGVFTTFTLEPEFFEEEIVSILAGDALIQEPKVRVIQLEEALRGEIGPLGVYYDPKGLRPDGPKKLDIRYVPVRVTTGVFHPKMVLLLTEPIAALDSSPETLIFGVLSANLTKSGWWSNMECAHFEEVAAGELCSYRNDLLEFLRYLRRVSGREGDHVPLNDIEKWLAKTKQTSTLDSRNTGKLRPRLVAGTRPLIPFLQQLRGSELSGASLEIISPFLDESKPTALSALVTKLAVREVRVFLPSAEDRTALVKPELYDAVRKVPGCCWAELPRDLLKLGKETNARHRGVHAKVYRFHKRSTKYEAIIVGSHNLTSAAHNQGGNVEASFVIEPESSGPVDWWLTTNKKRPREFEAASGNDEEKLEAYLPLEIAYHWDTSRAEVLWTGSAPTNGIAIESAGSTLFTLPGLRIGEWISLNEDQAAILESILKSTSLLEVTTEDQRAFVLVQEYGMSRKPSIISTWTVSDVLEYWSRLTPEQKAAYLMAKGGNIPEGLRVGVDDISPLQPVDSFFDTYAGIFHSFEMLRRQVRESLAADRERQADYLLFGKRHDSLPNLVQKVIDDSETQDQIQAYLILLSARQLLVEYRRSRLAFFELRRKDIKDLLVKIQEIDRIRSRLDLGPDGKAFIKWFEGHFIKSARPAYLS